MLWWLLLRRGVVGGEMIQAAGMYGSAAAGHCTCSSEKQADGCKFRKLSVHLSVCVVYICMHFSVCMVNQSFSDIKFFPTFLLFFSQNQASWTSVRCFGLNRKVSPTFSKHKRTVWASPQAPYLCSDNLKTLGTHNLCKISCSTWGLETPWAFFSFFKKNPNPSGV